MRIEIPGRRPLELNYLVLDFNGTLAVDGVLRPDAYEPLRQLRDQLQLHVVTADHHGTVRERLEGLSCELTVLEGGEHDEAKAHLVDRLGAAHCAAIGNGLNDRLMLQRAALGIAVVGDEGAAVATVQAADLVCSSLVSALGLLLKPARLSATLRR